MLKANTEYYNKYLYAKSHQYLSSDPSDFDNIQSQVNLIQQFIREPQSFIEEKYDLQTNALEKDLQDCQQGQKVFHEISLLKVFPQIEDLQISFQRILDDSCKPLISINNSKLVILLKESDCGKIDLQEDQIQELPSENLKFHLPMKLQEFASYLDKIVPIIRQYPGKLETQLDPVSGHYVSVNYKQVLKDNRFQEEYFMKITCLSPEIPIKSITKEGPLSIILTSGTLQPFNALMEELGIEFKEVLANKHVIQQDQICPAILCEGINGQKMNFRFENRENLFMMKDMAQTLLDLNMRIRGGMLVFFPSYSFMSNFIELMAKNSIIKKIRDQARKEVIVEQNGQGFNDQLDYYNNQIELMKSEDAKTRTNGAVFFGVARGKLSEGISLNDDGSRCVVLIGIPYPNQKDTKVMMKMHYLRNKRWYPMKDQTSPTLSPDDWYKFEAIRSVNQSIGRVIRHAKDYGVLALVDQRFDQIRKHLPQWVTTSLQLMPSYTPRYSEQKLDPFLQTHPHIDPRHLPQCKEEEMKDETDEINYEDLDECMSDDINEEEKPEIPRNEMRQINDQEKRKTDGGMNPESEQS